jgi:Spy/CpxP family protein refolding chaperone
MFRQKIDYIPPLTLIVVLCLGVLSTHSAIAEPARHGGDGVMQVSRGFGPHRMFKLLHDLDVSREQRMAIGEVMDKHRPIMREFMLDIMDGKKALQVILTSPDYDPAQIKELATTQARNAEQMFLATAKTFADISAILTPEQRQQLAEMIAERGDRRWNERRGHRDSM